MMENLFNKLDNNSVILWLIFNSTSFKYSLISKIHVGLLAKNVSNVNLKVFMIFVLLTSKMDSNSLFAINATGLETFISTYSILSM